MTQMMSARLSSRRGVALAAVTALALAAAIAAYGLLIIAVSQARHTTFIERRVRAGYAAEAGIAWAMEQLQTNSTFSSAAGSTDVTVDPDPGVPGDEISVDIILPACTATPCEDRRIQARVSYAMW